MHDFQQDADVHRYVLRERRHGDRRQRLRALLHPHV